MKILDLVDTSRSATAHLRDVGELPLQALLGTVPMTRAMVTESYPNQPHAAMNFVSFPETGGIKHRRIDYMRYSGQFDSGLTYMFDFLEKGLTERDTQLNLSITQTYITHPAATYLTANWQDLAYLMRSQTGALTAVWMGSVRADVDPNTGVRVKREIVIDRKRKNITWYAKHPTTGVAVKRTYNYAGYVGQKLVGIQFGIRGTFSAPGTVTLDASYTQEVLYEDILFTENDLPTDPPRHGPFELATMFDVVNSGHPNAALLNTRRKVPKVVTNRYTATTPVPITVNAPVSFTLSPTLLDGVTAKGKCVAVMVTADMKNVSGKSVCKAAVQDGRQGSFSTPRTHPFQQSIGMPGIGATVAQIDLRKPDGHFDEAPLGKSITLSVN